MINISNSTSKNNPPWRLAKPIGPTRQARQARPAAPGRGAAERVNPARSGRGLIIAGRGLIIAGRGLISWLAAVPRRVDDRLFVMNDAEAYWRGWQITKTLLTKTLLTKTQGGLGRSYRDPRFDALAECSKCRGAGITAALACLSCLGTGRITCAEVS